MFVKRDIGKAILDGAKQVPVIAIIGPRQSGKSTLAKKIFPDHVYIDMQDAQMFEFANQDPKGFLQNFKNKYGIIIDEAQYAPNLFAQIKVEADKNPQAGYFILSGSQNFLLHEKISESLSGRVYFYTLLPFSINELKHKKLVEPSIADQLMQGFYPRVYQSQVNRDDYYRNYISTYVERDIRSIRNIDNILTFKKFMKLCALNIGNVLNYTHLATSCGITVATVKSWLSLLETSFILFLLPPYFNNLGKRVIKSPKLFFYDVGLAISIMGLSKDTLIKQRMVYRALFENMSIVDLIKNNNANNIYPSLNFFRDTNQKEIDLIIEHNAQIIPIEIKANHTFSTTYFNTVQWFQENTKSNLSIIIYGGDANQKRTKGSIVSWKSIRSISDNLKNSDNLKK